MPGRAGPAQRSKNRSSRSGAPGSPGGPLHGRPRARAREARNGSSVSTAEEPYTHAATSAAPTPATGGPASHRAVGSGRCPRSSQNRSRRSSTQVGNARGAIADSGGRASSSTAQLSPAGGPALRAHSAARMRSSRSRFGSAGITGTLWTTSGRETSVWRRGRWGVENASCGRDGRRSTAGTVSTPPVSTGLGSACRGDLMCWSTGGTAPGSKSEGGRWSAKRSRPCSAATTASTG